MKDDHRTKADATLWLLSGQPREEQARILAETFEAIEADAIDAACKALEAYERRVWGCSYKAFARKCVGIVRAARSTKGAER